MVTALYKPESSKIIQKHVEDFEEFGIVRVKGISFKVSTFSDTCISPHIPALYNRVLSG